MLAVSFMMQGDSVFSLLEDSWYSQSILSQSPTSSVPSVEISGVIAGLESEADSTSARASNSEGCSTSQSFINGKNGIQRGCSVTESEMRKVFDEIDSNRDGLISEEELRQFMSCWGKDASDSEAHGLIACVDRNQDGAVDFEEFLSLYKIHEPDDATGDDKEEREALLGAFRVFDRNRDGFISAQELQAVLRQLGRREGKSLFTCKKMISRVDRDGDGQCDIRDFQKLMSE